MAVPVTAVGTSVVFETTGVTDGSSITVEVGLTESFEIAGVVLLAATLFGVWLNVL